MHQVLSLRQAKRLMDFEDNRSIEKWCRHNGVAVFCMENSNRRYIWELDFYTARDRSLQAISTKVSHSHKKREDLTESDYPDSTDSSVDPVGLQRYGVHLMPNEDKKIIQIPDYLKIPGYYIRCGHCRTWLRDQCKENEKHISSCPRQADLRLISVTDNPDGKGKKIKVLPTRDVEVGAQMHLNLRQGNKIDAGLENGNPAEAMHPPASSGANKTLSTVQDEYCDFIAGRTSSKFRKKIKSKKHQEEVRRVFDNVNSCLEEHEIYSQSLDISMLTEKHADLYCEQLESRGVSGRTFNKYVGIMKTFFRHLIKEKFVSRNPFDGIFQKDENAKREDTISQEKFEELIEAFKDRKIGMQKFAESRRSVWRDYLGDISRYGIFSGRRLTELVFSSWADVKCKNGIPSHIEFIDRKASSLKNDPNAKPKIITVPIIPELRIFLEEKGMAEKIGKQEFIIAPDSREKRERMTHIVSSAFSHYYKHIDKEGKPLTFHSLRRTYQTALTKAVGPELAFLYGGHANFSTMAGHYLNPIELLSEVKDTTVFENRNENTREKQLTEIRKPQQNIYRSK